MCVSRLSGLHHYHKHHHLYHQSPVTFKFHVVLYALGETTACLDFAIGILSCILANRVTLCIEKEKKILCRFSGCQAQPGLRKEDFWLCCPKPSPEMSFTVTNFRGNPPILSQPTFLVKSPLDTISLFSNLAYLILLFPS